MPIILCIDTKRIIGIESKLEVYFLVKGFMKDIKEPTPFFH